MKTFPHSPDEITVDWLNGVLRDAGMLDDDALVSVEVVPTEAGFGALGSYRALLGDVWQYALNITHQPRPM